MFIAHAGAQLFAVEFGSGARTLLAHGGWTGSWEMWAESFGTLSRTWRTVAYDHRGTGATIAPAESITLEVMVDDVFAVMDALAIERCVLAAESSGAAVALRAALRHPQRFAGLVIVDGLYHRDNPSGPGPFVLGLQRDYGTTVGSFVDLCVPEHEPNSAAIRRWGRQILARAPMPAAVRLIESLYGVDLRPEVARITQPTLVIHGDEDALVPLADAEWLAAHLPNARLHIVHGAGHVPTMTRAAEVAEAINGFFDGAVSERPPSAHPMVK